MPSRSASPGSLTLALLFPSSVAFAQAPPPAGPPPAERALVYSPYEQETIDEVLSALHATRDLAPEGMTIEQVDVVPLDVFEPRDPLPGWLNVFHYRSRESVIRRELLVHEGEPYQQVLVDDSLRNLRRLPQLSAVLVVATRGSAPDRVGVVVITKDVWSLRLNWDISVTPGGVELFEAQPAEWNFLGTHQNLSGHFLYQPSALTFGLGYIVPRVGTSRVAVRALADVVVNRRGSPEGSLGSVIAGQPLYSALTDWAWDASAAWQDYVYRKYSDAQLALYQDPATGVTMPHAYHVRGYQTAYELTRSFGWEAKHDVTLAANIDEAIYQTQFPGVDPITAGDFRALFVPVSDTRVGPSIQYHAYTTRFVRVIDFDTLALQEDFRLGHDVVLRVFPSFRAVGSTRDVVSLYGALQYTFAVRDGLFRASFASTTEPEIRPDRVADASVQPTAHFVSPTVAGLGRVVVDGTLLYRWRNYLNATDVIGGGDRLRGFPTNILQAANVVSYNVELRSRPVEILSCQLAAVAFFDAGDAFNHHLMSYQSAGAGVRALFPWLDRVVFRADIGFPFERRIFLASGSTPISPYGFNITFEQAFPTPTVSPPPVLPTGEQ